MPSNLDSKSTDAIMNSPVAAAPPQLVRHRHAAATTARWCAMVAIVLLVALHILKADYAPRWRFISEYSIGDFGFLMQGAFVAMGLSSLLIAYALWSHGRNIGAKIGLLLHVVVALSMSGAACFVSDPASLPPAQMTPHGIMHMRFAMLGIPSGAFAEIIVLYSMTRRGSADRAALFWPAWAVTISALGMVVYMAVLGSEGHIVGPGDYTGFVNRAVVAASLWWWLCAAAFARRVNAPSS